MHRYLLPAGVMALLALLLTGCDGDRADTAQRPGQSVSVIREFKGQQGPFPDRGFLVIRRPEAWAALWAGTPAPMVDFSTESVLVGLMGQQPTAGYDITIADVRTTGAQVVAYVNEERPDPGVAVAQVISYPYHMVVVPRVTQEVAFDVSGETPVAIQDSYQGQNACAHDPRVMVIRTQADWDRFWTTIVGVETVPPVELTGNMAVAVLLGDRPTAGYTVTIAGVQRVEDRLDVNYRVRAPQPNEITAQVITSPFAVAIVPSSPLPIAFRPLTAPVVAGR